MTTTEANKHHNHTRCEEIATKSVRELRAARHPGATLDSDTNAMVVRAHTPNGHDDHVGRETQCWHPRQSTVDSFTGAEDLSADTENQLRCCTILT